MCLKLFYRMFTMIEENKSIVLMLYNLLKFDMNLKQDMALSIIIGSVIKPLLLERSAKDDLLINLVISEIFPRTLDVMSENAPHILEMTQQIQCSLNLYIVMRGRFKDKTQIKEL